MRGNPGVISNYDPQEESVRAIGQGEYESQVKRLAGRQSSAPFRDRAGIRLDVRTGFFPNMFGMRTSVGWKRGRLLPGTQKVTAKASRESQRRYKALDPKTGTKFVGWAHLVNNRQDYEETLGLQRKSGFYRVVPETTRTGTLYFVWPMRPGRETPLGFTGKSAAKKAAAAFNKSSDPRETGQWWKPTKRELKKAEIVGWLPPDSEFQLRLLPPLERGSTKRGKVRKEKMDGRVVYKVYVGSIWTGKWAASPEKANKMARRAG